MALVPYSDPGILVSGNPLPAAYLNTTRANGVWFNEPPQCSVSSSTNQSLSDSTNTVLTCDTETFDNNAMHNPSTNTSRITAKAAGRYLVSANVQFVANGTGWRKLSIKQTVSSVSTTVNLFQIAAGGITEDVILSGSRVFNLAVDDYVECSAYQTSGGALNVKVYNFEAMLLSTIPA